MAGFFKKLIQRFTKADIDWDDLEAQLIAGDLGAKLSMQIVDDLKDQARKLHDQDIVEVTKKHIRRILPETVAPVKPFGDKPRSCSSSV
ncbi:signal recognition particle receptor subunit alpha [Verrucomicrobium spinosum]|uniref:signal recognition particle receptor subunit alpha n=1 Tax=Verrucomicrobium spinosum TaxID=2736 RepID=UPI000A43ED90|nr:signal recognition particle receptor subunit alpha [Verrucomicrobium spinosum]